MSELRFELARILVDLQIADNWNATYAEIQAAIKQDEDFERSSKTDPRIIRTECVEKWSKDCRRFKGCSTPESLFYRAIDIIRSLEDKLKDLEK